jgi:hypothetical protein
MLFLLFVGPVNSTLAWLVDGLMYARRHLILVGERRLVAYEET